MLNWSTDSDTIAAKVAGRHAEFKIVLKTRDEPEQLSLWVDHHKKIVGDAGIVIADNGSLLPETTRLLEEFQEKHSVFQYSDFYNNLHCRKQYEKLYLAIEHSSAFHTVLDTDERLVWLEHDSWLADSSILKKLRRCRPGELLPANLVTNLPTTDDTFYFHPRRKSLIDILKWGKPIVSSGTVIEPGIKIHTCNFPLERFSLKVPNGLFQIHLVNLFPEARIRANLHTLAAHGFIVPSVADHEILNKELREEIRRKKPLLQRYVHEIKNIREHGAAHQPGAGYRTVQLTPSGTLHFGEKPSALMKAFMDSSGEQLHALLRDATG